MSELGPVMVRSHALRQLMRALETSCPDLKGRITAEADRDERMGWPKLGIALSNFTFMPSQRSTLRRLNDNTVVHEVGFFRVTALMRLGDPTAQGRADLGELVSGAFYTDATRPGILVTTIPECWDAVCAWSLDEDAWQDEMVFEKKAFIQTTLTGVIPALTKSRAYKISDLRLVFTSDMTTAAASIPAASQETVRINADGSTTPL